MRQEEKLNRVEEAIRSFYEEKTVAPHLVYSVLYSIQAGGKRLRPLLLLELLEAFGQDLTDAHFQVAGALEMVHTGSLIHDDLPAMDDDDYRRGQLTNHKKFGEDLAILAGDALFLDPFGMIATSQLPDTVKVALILELSDASGSRGMVAGQVLDMEGEHKQLTLEELQTIHANKTGRLLAYPFIAADIRQLLKQLGQKLGLAFQVRDDILDLVADFEALGKTPQKDLVAEKSTYPALLGLEASKALLERELDACGDLLDQLVAICAFHPQAIKKLIEGLRIHG